MEEMIARDIAEAEKERKRLEALIASRDEENEESILDDTILSEDTGTLADKLISSSEASSLKMEEQIAQ